MKRPIIESGDARILIYASRAGENITAMDLIKACDNRIAYLKKELQKSGKMVVKVDKLATPLGDIEIIAKWVLLGAKRTKRRRSQENAGSSTSEQVPGRAEARTGVQEGKSI